MQTLSPENLRGLHPMNTDIFSFLNNHAKSPIEKSVRSKVKTALSTGLAISTDIYLETKRSMKFRGDEKFVVHWVGVDAASIVSEC